MINHHEKYWTIWACVLIFHAAWANPSMFGKSWRDPFLDKSSDTLKSCERDVRRLQRSKEKNGWSCWITWQKDGMCSTPTWLIHTQGVWSVTRKISPIPITDDKTYLYICTCTYLYDMYIYIPVYNVSIYTYLHVTTTILYWISSTPGKLKKTLRISQLSRPHLLGRRLADANKEKVKITGTPEVMSPRTFQITDKDEVFEWFVTQSGGLGIVCTKNV